MAIETNAVTINDLNPLYPRDKDYIYEGAAHMRLMKQVIKNTFPGINSPVNIDSEQLNLFNEKINMTGDAMDVGKLMIKNATPGTGDADLTTKGQVESIVKDWFQNKVYKVGSYYITEDELNPGDVGSLGFGTWAKVTGMIMGSGVVNPDGSVPNASRVEFTKGGTGGRVFNTVTSDNLPLTTVNVTGETDSYSHNHSQKLANVRLSIDDRRFYLESVDGRYPNDNTRNTTQDTHKHKVTASGSFGKDDISRQPINTMPPYRVANVWRRTA